MMRCGWVWLAVLGVAVAGLVGCSGGGDDSRVAELAAANEKLSQRLEKQSAELRQLSKRLADLDILVQQHDSALPQIRDDLRNRIKEMIAQESNGRNRWRRPQPKIEPKFEVKPYMGFDAQDLLPDVAEHLKLEAKEGVLVTDVRPGSPAAVAGLEKHDVIQQFDGKEIEDFKDLKKAFAGKKPGETVSVTVLRGEKKVEFKVKLGAKKVRVG
jgi:C-terminal processing protease CtpA/Prc